MHAKTAPPALPGFLLIATAIVIQQSRADETPKDLAETWKAQEEARCVYWQDREAIQLKYRKLLGDIIKKADRIELFLLDFSMPETESDPNKEIEVFPISPYQTSTRVLEKFIVPPKDVPAIAKVIADALSGKEGDGGALCHYPIHGIKVFRADVPIFTTSLCWVCGNYYCKYPDGFVWNQMGGDFAELRKTLEELVPIPPEEIERFKKSMGKPVK